MVAFPPCGIRPNSPRMTGIIVKLSVRSRQRSPTVTVFQAFTRSLFRPPIIGPTSAS